MNKIADASPAAASQIRPDQQHIADLIEPGSRVLDVGCGDGALLYHLAHQKQVDGRGIELSRDGVTACFHLGLSVIQGDAETDLKDYPTAGFDYAILSQTLQTIHDIKGAVDQLLRIGKRAIVSFPNFGHWRVRWQLLIKGRAPATDALPHDWYDSPNIRTCTILDFLEFCHKQGIAVEKVIALDNPGSQIANRSGDASGLAIQIDNLRAAHGLFLISRK